MRALIQGLIFILIAVPLAYAQVTLDVSKLTCEQYILYKITNPDNITLWLNGYYNGKKGNTIIEPELFKDNAKKVKEYCRLNLKMTVMQAAETVLGVGK